MGTKRGQAGRGGVPRGDGPARNVIRKQKGDGGDQRVRVGETGEAGGTGAGRGRVTRRGAPLPSRLPGQGPRPGRSAGPGRLSSFLCCDPGVRPAPPLTTMEAEAEAVSVAEAATAAVAAHGIRIRSQTGLIGPASSGGFFSYSTHGRRSDSGGWFRIGGFRPSGRKQAPVSGRSGLVVTP